MNYYNLYLVIGIRIAIIKNKFVNRSCMKNNETKNRI